jgi:recombination protein RecT
MAIMSLEIVGGLQLRNKPIIGEKMSTKDNLKAIATGKTNDVAAAAGAAGRDPAIAALTHAMGKIKNVLPKHITPERMARIVTGELRTNAKLAEVARKNPTSLVNAVLVASRCGLEIGGPNPQGHLVPHGNEIVFYPDYRGKLALMRRSGELASFSLEPVYANDEFEMSLGFDKEIKHKPFIKGDRGEFILVYFAATLTNGERVLVWMDKEKIEHVRKKSKMGNAGAWISDWEEMAKKTVIHRASKTMPMSVEYRIAEAAERAADEGKAVSLHEEDSDLIIEGESEKVDEPKQAQIEHKLPETIPFSTKEMETLMNTPPESFTERPVTKKTIDKSTGEIVEKEIPFHITAEHLAKRFAETKDVDVLDADASLISQITDEETRKDLSQMYLAKRSKLMPF